MMEISWNILIKSCFVYILCCENIFVMSWLLNPFLLPECNTLVLAAYAAVLLLSDPKQIFSDERLM